MQDKLLKLRAKKPGTCPSCQKPIEPGDMILWDRAQKMVQHVGCVPLQKAREAVYPRHKALRT
jgi:predicted amidophosphoribosyltransferase